MFLQGSIYLGFVLIFFGRFLFFFAALDFVVKHLVWKMAQGQDKDIFGVLTQGEKLDGTNYSL